MFTLYFAVLLLVITQTVSMKKILIIIVFSLLITVSADDRDALMADAADVENPELSIDLETQTIRRPNGVKVSFEIDPFRKQCLLEGLDDIGLTLEKGGSIDSFEATRAEEKPWL